MINIDTPYANNYKNTSIVVLTKDNELEFMNVLATHDIIVHRMDTIVTTIDSWEVSPDTIVLDSLIDVTWEEQLNVLRNINTFKDIPVIVLNKEEVDTEASFSTWDREFTFVGRNNATSIIQTILSTVKHWRKLNEAFIKTNQLNRILSTNYLVLDAKNECLEKVQKQLSQLQDIVSQEIQKALITVNETIADNLKKGDHYQLFKAHFEEVHPLFYKKLLVINKNLSNNDLKLAAFLKMNFNNSEISFFMGISMAGVKKAIQRLRTKLGLQPAASLRQFIFTIEV